VNLLAFDLGGSGGKLLQGRFDGERIGLSEIARFENRPVRLGGGLYWDMIGICRFLLESLQKASALSEIHSLGIDSFSNDFGLLDRAGELLSPVRCYRDERTVRHSGYIYSRISPRRLYEITGNQNARFNTLMQLGAIRGAGQGWLLDNADKCLFVPDLLTFFLTGEKTAEYTIASVSQLFSFERRDFSEELLGLLRLRRELFGPVSMPGAGIGTITETLAREQGLSRFKVVSICEHDTASAYIASPLNRKDRVIISSGTWSLMGCELEAPLLCEEGFRHNFANEGSYPGHHRFLRNVMGSWIIQEIMADYHAKGRNYSYADMEREAETAAPFAFFINVDDDMFFSPGGMPDKIRQVCRERYGKAPEEPGPLLRCVYESLAMKYRYTLDLLKRITGRTFSIINIVGGGARDSLLCRFTADACNCPVAAGPQEATALGNLLVQLVAAGELSSIEQGRAMMAVSFPPLQYEPLNAGLWEAQYQRFLENVPPAEENPAP
jgi:sugar (pentulose or hexulose) kinase